MELSKTVKKKLASRDRKYSNMIMRETGISPITFSQNLMICNVGLVSGMDIEQIFDIFSKFGSIQKVVMIPKKSYCFIRFSDEKWAREAYDSVHGKLVIPKANGPLYLLYTEQVPNDIECDEEDDVVCGLELIHDFLTDDEENLLIYFMKSEFGSVELAGDLKHRTVKHYGYEFDYKTNGVKEQSQCNQIPKTLQFLIDRVQNLNTCQNWNVDQITVNKYEPGQGIPPHCDTHSVFDEFIVSISISSDILMEFRNETRRRSILLPRKSALIMSGESRYGWEHCIVPRKYDVVKNNKGELTIKTRQQRISFTLRGLRTTKKCDCKYEKYCDTKTKKQNDTIAELNIDDETASKLEEVHVHQIYNKIAGHFSETRHKPWPNIEEFVKSFEPASIYVDIGCGNGKYFGLNGTIFEMGCDRSDKLSEECSARGFQSLVCDCLRLPFRTSSADYCTCIAVIHHLSTKERRIQAVREILRILRVDGKALIYVWAKNQKQDEQLSSYLKQRGYKKSDNSSKKQDEFEVDITTAAGIAVEKKSIKLPVHVNRTQFKHDDMLVPWKLKTPNQSELKSSAEDCTFLRFYHVFDEGEMEELCGEIDEIKIVKSYYDQGNWCVIIQKLDK